MAGLNNAGPVMQQPLLFLPLPLCREVRLTACFFLSSLASADPSATLLLIQMTLPLLVGRWRGVWGLGPTRPDRGGGARAGGGT